MNESTHGENRRFIVSSVWLSLFLAALLVAGIWLFAKAQPVLLSIQIREAAFAGDYDKASAGMERLMQLDQKAALSAALSAAEIADYRNDWAVAVQWIDTYANGSFRRRQSAG